MKKYELVEHTADIAIKAYGDSLEEVFASAAEAMFELITGTERIGHDRQVVFNAKSGDREGLLVNFLSSLIAFHEIENVVFGKFSVTFGPGFSLRAVGWGEKFSRRKHGHGTPVKGVSYHMMEIVDGQGKKPGYAVVLFDV